MKATVDVLLALLLIVAYWLPSIAGKLRHVRGLGQVVIVNAFLGWTFIGWIVALVMAFRYVPPAPPKHAASEATELDAALSALKAARDDDPHLDDLAQGVKDAIRRDTRSWN